MPSVFSLSTSTNAHTVPAPERVQTLGRATCWSRPMPTRNKKMSMAVKMKPYTRRTKGRTSQCRMNLANLHAEQSKPLHTYMYT